MRRQILAIEDQDFAVSHLFDHRWLRSYNIASEMATWDAFARDRGVWRSADLVVAVAPSNPASGTHFVELLRDAPPHAAVLALLPDREPDDLLWQAAQSADDFMVWCADRMPELYQRVLRMLGSVETTTAVRNLTESVALSKLIGRDSAFVDTLSRLPTVARTGTTVLIAGETGTGKELCARAIHHLSPRRHQPFVPVDCAALPEQLLENELFGHVRGAFTDAHRDHCGLLGVAEGGTLFLDEIDSLAQSAQAKILRLLEDRTFRPLGSSRFERADVRIVAATNASLDALVAQNRFRADLFFRLNVVRLSLPPLRDRPGDIALLARHFVARICAEAKVPKKTLTPAAVEVLIRAPWPGNVRELFNVVQNAVLFSEGPSILAHHLAVRDVTPASAEGTDGAVAFNDAKARAIARFERAYLEALLRKHGGNITRCAIEAKKDRRAFGRLVKKHHIDRRVG